MNLLCHLYLSGSINKLMLGNFMGDYVKGNKFNKYEEQVKFGILLHREIDTFSDNHSSHKVVRDLFRPAYRLYSSVVTDIVFDYFLAKNWSDYTEVSLEEYAQDVYKYLLRHIFVMPTPLQKRLPFIVKNNWLLRYQTFEGIGMVLTGMSKYTSVPEQTQHALKVIEDNRGFIEDNFEYIFSDLKKMVKKSEYFKEKTDGFS